MRILVMSDSHGDFFAVKKAVETQKSAELIFFLGDGLREFEDIKSLYPERPFYAVKGNCDFGSSLPAFDIVDTCYGKILYTHGDYYGVKLGSERLCSAARKAGARLVLFGHTHAPESYYDNGLYVFNPGSLGHGGCYGICDLLDSGILMNHVKV